ncbi:hydrogenase maturation protease [Mycolicibacterium sp.]|uniref:hydrogenase maturation protease n=1 Tax=Mycolicibacterium sp. TaxID=2320850 RepID=UPI003D12B274
MSPPPAVHELLDDGYPPDPCEVLVIGCGNILRGDDAVGPVLIRELAAAQGESAVPDGVRLVDGGTAGMDVAFAMRGAQRVVLVDAARAGNPAGTVYRVPADALAPLPPLEGLHSHNFRWDHALAFADWLLGPLRPRDVTVLLVEAGSFEPGAALTPAVAAAMRQVIGILRAEFWPAQPPPVSRDEVSDGRIRGHDPGRLRPRPLGGPPGGDDPRRGAPPPAAGLPHRGAGAADGRHRAALGGPAPTTGRRSE